MQNEADQFMNLSESWTDKKSEKLTVQIVAKTIKPLTKDGYIGKNYCDI